MGIKSGFKFIWEVLQVVIIALAIVAPIRLFVFQPFIVKGASMEPAFHGGDYLIIDEISYRFSEPQRGEIIVFKYPLDKSQRFIKRIIGLPGEKVDIDKGRVIITSPFGDKTFLNELYITTPFSEMQLENNSLTLGQNEYFVMGDNRTHSFDSRQWGVLNRVDIIGRVIFRAWPPLDVSFFPDPQYSQ
ncbi:MAG: signal peptidase I [Candidatus Pacebacteria bacterium]|nr:signal peptidase I [Candidatus Paceibacterota bacterium]